MLIRSYSLLVGAAAALSCTTLIARAPAPATPGPSLSPQQQRQISVTQFYMDNCSKCHGANGEGGGGGTKSLNTLDKYDQKWDKPFFEAIKKGVPDMGMDAYGQTNSDEAIWAQVVHIRELQYRALRAAGEYPKPVDGVYHSKYANYRVETVVDERKGLILPWAFDWLPDGRMLITNRSGFMFVAKGGDLGPEVEGLPRSVEIGQGGLMDVAVHPDYAKNGWIYLSYTEPKKGSDREGLTKIVRGKLKFDGSQATWTDQQTIFEADQEFYTGAGIHFGSKIVFDGKGHVFFDVGERGGNMLAQDINTPFGKIYRVNEDGTVPSDNPFAEQAKTGKKHVGAIWSLGHRNPQGLTMALDGNLYDTEHAPRGGDEFNHIQKGANYGWPVICFGINYNDSPFKTPWPGPGQNFTMPLFRWLPSIGTSGLDTVKGAAFPAWKGDMVAGGLSGKNVDRFRIVGDKLVEHEELLWNLGRVREVAVGPDGCVYVGLNEPDKIIRLVPAK